MNSSLTKVQPDTAFFKLCQSPVFDCKQSSSLVLKRSPLFESHPAQLARLCARDQSHGLADSDVLLCRLLMQLVNEKEEIIQQTKLNGWVKFRSG